MKTCNRCLKSKDFTHFHKNKLTKDGLLNQCKECVLKAQKKFRDENFELMQERNFVKNKNLSSERRQKRYEYTRKWREKNPEKLAAHVAVTQAKIKGILRPEPCKLCGKKAEAHHDDYSKALEVQWLCSYHHKERHRELGW